MATKYSEWLAPLIRFQFGDLSKDLKLDIHRYILSKTDKNGLVYDQNGHVDILASNASLHLYFMAGKLKKRLIEKSSVILKQVIKHRLEAEGVRPNGQKEPIFSLEEFTGLIFTMKLIESISGRNIFAECDYDPQKLVKQYLHMFRKPDGLFSDSDATGESSLWKTAMAVLILQAVGLTPADFDRNLDSTLRAQLEQLRLERGGYCDRISEPVGSISRSVAGIYLSAVLSCDTKGKPSVGPKSSFEATSALIDRLRTASGGYRSDGLSPSPDLFNTFLAIVAFGMLNKTEYDLIPGKEKTIDYLNSLERRDGGMAADEWSAFSDVQSSFLGLLSNLFLSNPSILY